MFDNLVEEIGEENVLQVIRYNESNYVLASKSLEENRPNLYWTPYVAHCIDLILEEIGKLPLLRKTIQGEVSLIDFIYNRSITLSLLRQFTNKRELVRHITKHLLHLIYHYKDFIKRMES
ncbi:hypothetical protein V8G54_017991 [Vigna mungo]|uniref:DUF659 domain-containing protein n=1 Tax=Vigna mungo TaxID=3915 RepID=A0AAQ3N955_VIGMU